MMTGPTNGVAPTTPQDDKLDANPASQSVIAAYLKPLLHIHYEEKRPLTYEDLGASYEEAKKEQSAEGGGDKNKQTLEELHQDQLAAYHKAAIQDLERQRCHVLHQTDRDKMEPFEAYFERLKQAATSCNQEWKAVDYETHLWEPLRREAMLRYQKPGGGTNSSTATTTMGNGEKRPRAESIVDGDPEYAALKEKKDEAVGEPSIPKKRARTEEPSDINTVAKNKEALNSQEATAMEEDVSQKKSDNQEAEDVGEEGGGDGEEEGAQEAGGDAALKEDSALEDGEDDGEAEDYAEETEGDEIGQEGIERGIPTIKEEGEEEEEEELDDEGEVSGDGEDGKTAEDGQKAKQDPEEEATETKADPQAGKGRLARIGADVPSSSRPPAPSSPSTTTSASNPTKRKLVSITGNAKKRQPTRNTGESTSAPTTTAMVTRSSRLQAPKVARGVTQEQGSLQQPKKRMVKLGGSKTATTASTATTRPSSPTRHADSATTAGTGTTTTATTSENHHHRGAGGRFAGRRRGGRRGGRGGK